ncbi:Uncharacterised protein [Kluyvera cryocrescens]|uniref:Uncharacterized protein n=1 Tax=Kluyvera cryocrescens TaxID=580 RepID=A0A485CZG1_KLUCR|nr:Uncharacterised protein [Kluyvera cryocrescens]
MLLPAMCAIVEPASDQRQILRAQPRRRQISTFQSHLNG